MTETNTNSNNVKIKGSTVLVVEDNVSNFVLIARMLGYMGIHCEWKTSGYEVVEYADTLPRLDLVLMDIRLPYEDGYGALKKIRNSPSLRNTKVIAVTAEASPEQMEKARNSGFDGFIGKPRLIQTASRNRLRQSWRDRRSGKFTSLELKRAGYEYESDSNANRKQETGRRIGLENDRFTTADHDHSNLADGYHGL